MIRPGRLGAAGVLLALAAAGVYAGAIPAPELPPAPQPEATPAFASSSPATSASRRGATIMVRPTPLDPQEVVAEGLAAWGRFAVTGDLATVAPWFDDRGPQWEVLRKEAPALAEDAVGDPPYTVTVEDPVVAGDRRDLHVEARVRFVRTGEPSQSFRWLVHLRRGDQGRWKIWTVEDMGGESSQDSSSSPSMLRP